MHISTDVSGTCRLLWAVSVVITPQCLLPLRVLSTTLLRWTHSTEISGNVTHTYLTANARVLGGLAEPRTCADMYTWRRTSAASVCGFVCRSHLSPAGPRGPADSWTCPGEDASTDTQTQQHRDPETHLNFSGRFLFFVVPSPSPWGANCWHRKQEGSSK